MLTLSVAFLSSIIDKAQVCLPTQQNVKYILKSVVNINSLKRFLVKKFKQIYDKVKSILLIIIRKVVLFFFITNLVMGRNIVHKACFIIKNSIISFMVKFMLQSIKGIKTSINSFAKVVTKVKMLYFFKLLILFTSFFNYVIEIFSCS